MNEQAEQALAALLERAVSGIDAAVEFSQAQIPEVVQQLLMWKAIESALSMVVSVLIFAGLAFLARWVIRGFAKPQERVPKEEKRWSHRSVEYKPTFFKDDDGDVNPITLMLSVPFVIGTMAALGFLDLDWLQIWIAPKLYLLEYAAQLVK